MSEKELDKVSAYLNAIIALCTDNTEKSEAVKVLAMDLSNYLYNQYGVDGK